YKPWRMAVWLGHLARLSFGRLVPAAELFHSTEHLLMPLGDTPTVLTVHDLIYKRFPEHHKRLNYWFLNRAMPLFCRRATALIAVSQATRRDLIDAYGPPADKITVVYEAAAPHFRPPSPQAVARAHAEYSLPGRYLIHLGTIEPRKNLGRLLAALKLLGPAHPDLHLVVAGAKGWLTKPFFAQLAAEGLERRVQLLGWLPDDTLPAVIAGAALAVQPSLYEGFGLPVLEHMGCGQVVAASRAGSHPEVGGQAAAYFDPLNVEEMAAVIGRLLADDEEYAERRRLGLEQAGRFSWERAAAETEAVYDRLLA
ncbi:MAG: glycosyltransferase family 4 protein, partial [Candidatus Promineifilaceae bacterium]